MKRKLPAILSLALGALYLAPGAILEAALRLQGGTLRPGALLIAYMAGVLLIVFPICWHILPRSLSRLRLHGAARMLRGASIHALHLVLAFLPPWQIASYFDTAEVPRILMTGGGAAMLLLLLDPVFRSFGYGFFDE